MTYKNNKSDVKKLVNELLSDVSRKRGIRTVSIIGVDGLNLVL